MKNPALLNTLIDFMGIQLKQTTGPFIFIMAIILLNVPMASAQVGVHTDFPDASSAMEIYAPDKGLLIPRVVLSSSLTSPIPVTSPATGLLVFNTGANQPVGFYYWDGSQWVSLGGSSNDDYWSLTGNAGTTVGTNFIGTTDNQDFALYTDESERMRITAPGNVVIGGTSPAFSTDLFTVIGKPGLDYAINAYSPWVGVFSKALYTGLYGKGGRYALVATVDTASTAGYAILAKNYYTGGTGALIAGSNADLSNIGGRSAGIASSGYDGIFAFAKNANGYGIISMGSNTTPYTIAGRSAGLSSAGNDGVIAVGKSATGRGVIAGGTNQLTLSTSLESEGGAFTGWHGVYGKGVNANGVGIIGVGSNASTYSIISGGLGGSFSGNNGAYGKGLATEGIGVIGVGSGGSNYNVVTGGSGGSFKGYHGMLAVGANTTMGTGVIGSGNDGIFNIMPAGSGGSFTAGTTGVAGFGTSATAGVGVFGAGNNQGIWLPSGGSGGAFIGNIGLFSKAVATNGTGVVGIGNNLSSPGTYTDGSGGSFTGSSAGAVSWATASSGTGVIGAGNNTSPTTVAGGSGGSFTGNVCGVYGYATNTSDLRYGGYFAAGGNVNSSGVGYAYVGGRAVAANNTTYQSKIVGAGTVQTIVKNTEGKLIALTCPEAPEMVFQDFGTGNLINGIAHVTIDPDLAININVNDQHPLKVYVTPEGDCNGVYVTNKSANGFDVIELRGGTSNVPFSWQIVATRANEEYILDDGSIEVSVYSHRFPPAPGPLEMTVQPADTTQMIIHELIRQEKIVSDEDNIKAIRSFNENILRPSEDTLIEITDDPK